MFPRIVVGIGIYNDAQYLDESIPSVLRQTEPDLGLLLMDNGSTDDTFSVMQRYQRSDRRIRLIRSARNLTAPEAANFGWGMALEVWPTCPWFIGMGADDIMDDDYLEAILHVASIKPDVNCIFSPARFIGHPQKGIYVYPPYNAREAHLRLMVPGWRAFTRELWTMLGGEWTGINQGSDWEWIVRASAAGILRPHQMHRSYLSLRIRTERVAESDRADKPALSARLHAIMRGEDA